MLRRGQGLFTYLHLAADPTLTRDLMASGATCIAYETVTGAGGGLPLLTPMSEVAGRLAPQVGAAALQKAAGGRGILLGGVPGVAPGKVVIIGGGVSGTQAAEIALGMGADVTLIDRSVDALKRISARFGGAVKTLFSTMATIRSEVAGADLVIGTVLVPGAEAPKLITRDMLSDMKAGSVIVDVAIDQGGCCETSRATTHAEPTYIVDGIVHYCVANMPGAVPRTSTLALNNATLPFVLVLANKGWRIAAAEDPHLRNGLNVHEAHLTCRPVAEAQNCRSLKSKPYRLIAAPHLTAVSAERPLSRLARPKAVVPLSASSGFCNRAGAMSALRANQWRATESHVDGLNTLLGTGMGWSPPPYRKRQLQNVLFAVNYADGRFGLHNGLEPEEARKRRTCRACDRPRTARRRAGDFPPRRD